MKKFFKSQPFATFKFKFYQIYKNGSKCSLNFIDMVVALIELDEILIPLVKTFFQINNIYLVKIQIESNI
jgi:hypothetical protein